MMENKDPQLKLYYLLHKIYINIEILSPVHISSFQNYIEYFFAAQKGQPLTK